MEKYHFVMRDQFYPEILAFLLRHADWSAKSNQLFIVIVKLSRAPYMMSKGYKTGYGSTSPDDGSRSPSFW